MKKIMMLTLFFAMITCPAMAYNPGDFELMLGGSGSSDESFDGTVFSIQAGLGYFLTENVEIIARQGIAFADVPGDNVWDGSTRVGLDYNIDMGTFQPYVGAHIGYLYGDRVKDQFTAGPELGLKTFVNTTTFILTGLEYQFIFDEFHNADDNFDTGRFIYTIGMGFKW